MKSFIILVILASVVYAQNATSVQVFATNSFESNCQFPPTVLFSTFNVTSSNITQFWGTAPAAAIYNSDSNSIIFKCVVPGVCDPATYAFRKTIDSIDLDTASSVCTIVYIDYFNDGECYTQWVCGSNWQPSTSLMAEEDALTYMEQNEQRYFEAVSKRLLN